MYKIRDFIDKEVFLVSGKRVGIVGGLFIDFNNMRLRALKINRFGFLKNKFISCNDIVYIGSIIIVSGISEKCGIDISNVLLKNVYDKGGILKGNVSDVLISEQTLELGAIICYRGISKKISEGDIIIPVNEVILGDKYILDKGKGNITFNSVIHKAKEEMLNENSK